MLRGVGDGTLFRLVFPALSHDALFPPPLAREVSRGFAALDEAILARTGVLVARAPSVAAAYALSAHVARRATLAGLSSLRAVGGEATSIWSEVATRLHAPKLEGDPALAATQLLDAARARQAVVIAPLPPQGSWDRAVAMELVRLEPSPCFLLVARPGDAIDGFAEEAFDITALDDADRARFFAAIADEARRTLIESDLASLEAWWVASRSIDPAAVAPPVELDASAAHALMALTLAARAWPVGRARVLGVNPNVVTVARDDGGWLAVAPTYCSEGERLAAQASAETITTVANALCEVFPTDAHALLRSSELLLRIGSNGLADERFGRALVATSDVFVRREVVTRWARAVDGVPVEHQPALRMAAGERALAVGEADEACRWAKVAAQQSPKDPAARLLLGRASVALGDLVTAKLAFEHGEQGATDEETRALIANELAEIAYLTGDFVSAREGARAVLARKPSASSQLRARNTLGKLMLAGSRWKEAETHFAEDALLASAEGDHTAELRARVNRGIALLSQGRVDEARSTFEAVLQEGESSTDARAAAFALDNLAVVAMWRHEYGLALELLERTLKIRQRLGDRLSSARILANLADLRRKLGLYEHADHAIAFGRRLLAPGMPNNVSEQFAVVAARLALARGNSAQAQREVATALTDGSAIENAYLSEDYRVAVRAALDDGDLARAETCLTKARSLATTEEAVAEVAVLHLALARASGTVTLELVHQAVTAARGCGEEELTREAHMLAHHVLANMGEHGQARMHLDQAVAMRDIVAATVSGDVRAAFLSRADVAELAKLVALVQTVTLRPEDEDGPRTQRSPRGPRVREMVGDDPTIRGLKLAIRRVAKADSTVLIHGESGTGKELVAEAIHRSSDRAQGPLVTVNCGALVETLLLSELFGHEKGSFTGAVARRRGRFEIAEGGTLFLDEIGDISPRTQVALLRVLQERSFERVGGTTSIKANVRIVCATHRDLKGMVERGEFREDLYYRLRGVTLEVPALRSRLGDLTRLCDHLLERIADERGETKKSLSADSLELLARHRWPGNVRELDNVLRAVSLFAETSTIATADLTNNVEELRAVAHVSRTLPPAAPSSLEAVQADDEGETEVGPLPAGEAGPTAVAYACVRQGTVSLSDLKRQIERDCIARALADTRGNITKAAALLGMKRPRLSQLVKQYGLAAVATEHQ